MSLSLLQQLPNEILTKIIKLRLTYQDIICIKRTNKWFYVFVNTYFFKYPPEFVQENLYIVEMANYPQLKRFIDAKKEYIYAKPKRNDDLFFSRFHRVKHLFEPETILIDGINYRIQDIKNGF